MSFFTLITIGLYGQQSPYNKTAVVFSLLDKTKEKNNLNQNPQKPYIVRP